LGIHTTKHKSIVDGLFLGKFGSLYNKSIKIPLGIHTTTYSLNIPPGVHTTKHKSMIIVLFFREFRESL